MNRDFSLKLNKKKTAKPSFTPKQKKIVSWIFIVCFPFLIIHFMESIVYPYGIINFQAQLISGFMAAVLWILLFSITKKLFLSGTLLTFLLYCFYSLNNIVYRATGWGFSPSDFSWLAKTDRPMSYVDASLLLPRWEIAPALAAIFLIFYFAAKNVDIQLAGRKRTALCITTVCLTGIMLFTNLLPALVLPALQIPAGQRQNTNYLYQRNGFLLGFYIQAKQSATSIRSVYDQAYMAGIVDRALKLTGGEGPETDAADATDPADPAGTAGSGDITPNVIVIVSESFDDVSTWPNVEFSRNPVENFNKYAASHSSGQLVVPALGGLPGNTEYEYLTGNAIVNLGHNRSVFQYADEFIPDGDKRSIPAMFRENGYRTVAVQPFAKAYHNRHTVYPRVGFDEFIALEDMKDPVEKGYFVSDEYFTDQLISQLERSDQPLFLYGVSMQNHEEFFRNKYPDYDVTGNSPYLDETLNLRLDSYLQGIYDADQQLGRLISYLEGYDEPTILVFFGNHKPAIDITQTFFDTIGLYDEYDQELYRTPYLIWNNFDLEVEDYSVISPYYLGALTAELANIEKNNYYRFLTEAFKEFKAYSFNTYVNDSGTAYFAPPADPYPEILEIFEALQYDRVSGEGYAYEALSAYSR